MYLSRIHLPTTKVTFTIGTDCRITTMKNKVLKGEKRSPNWFMSLMEKIISSVESKIELNSWTVISDENQHQKYPLVPNYHIN